MIVHHSVIFSEQDLGKVHLHNLEGDSFQRFNRFSNALINYDYKTGNYVGYWENKYPQMVNVFIEIARGAKKPA